MKKPATIHVPSDVNKIIQENQAIRLDVGCGGNKMPGFVGMDYRKLDGVDIVHDVLSFPWPLPNESVSTALASHLVEHLPPMAPDPKLTNLIKLLLDKKIFTPEECRLAVGEHDTGPMFMRFMNEVWRILRYDGEFGMVFPYARSHGMLQDPTHINFINEDTWEYFDPMGPRTNGQLWGIYKPLPWKIKSSAYSFNGNMEVVLIKRRIDKSYYGNEETPLNQYLETKDE